MFVCVFFVRSTWNSSSSFIVICCPRIVQYSLVIPLTFCVPLCSREKSTLLCVLLTVSPVVSSASSFCSVDARPSQRLPLLLPRAPPCPPLVIVLAFSLALVISCCDFSGYWMCGHRDVVVLAFPFPRRRGGTPRCRPRRRPVPPTHQTDAVSHAPSTVW